MYSSSMSVLPIARTVVEWVDREHQIFEHILSLHHRRPSADSGWCVGPSDIWSVDSIAQSPSAGQCRSYLVRG